jgi:hypothetical protein
MVITGRTDGPEHSAPRGIAMTSQIEIQDTPSFSYLAFGGGTPRKALLTAILVGTILTSINHGDMLVSGDWPPVWKVLLTYFVPYCVTTWGAITGKRSLLRRNAV